MAGAAVLVPVLPNHRFDEAALLHWLEAELPGFRGPLDVQQFQGGQSNPTFHLATPGGAYVLRKKPPGTLLPSAHQVEREYRVMRALAGSPVPVPTMRALCEDAAVIGTAFFVMDYVPGRVFTDRALPGCAAEERRALYMETARTMAALHGVDWRAAGLEGFGRPDGYVRRQIDRWSRQYAASRTEDVPDMERLMRWLPEHVPAEAPATVAHGDFRLGNLLFAPDAPRAAAVLDWELATIGDPWADLAYSCLSWRLPPEADGIAGLDVPGLPTEAEYVAEYCRHAGLDGVPELEFFVAFSMFRWAAIAAGVYRRALDGNAADARGLRVGEKFRTLAATGWEIAARA